VVRVDINTAEAIVKESCAETLFKMLCDQGIVLLRYLMHDILKITITVPAIAHIVVFIVSLVNNSSHESINTKPV
jgi:hypothetical protein